MPTARKLTANRLNAARSTGPRTPAGKKRVGQNSVVHGLRSVNPVLPNEDPADWELFRAGVAADLRPVGVLEAELANRIASLMWRLRRVTAFEVAAAVAPPDADPARPARLGWHDPTELKDRRRQLEDAERPLAAARRRHALVARLAEQADGDRLNPDDAVFLLDSAADIVRPPSRLAAMYAALTTACGNGDATREAGVVEGDAGAPPDPFADESGITPAFLAGLGVPPAFADEPERWDGWTAGRVRAGCAVLAGTAERTTHELYRQLLDIDFAWLEGRVATARAAVDRLTAAALGPTAIPPDAALEAVVRYEGHLSRQLSAAQAQLEQARALRRG